MRRPAWFIAETSVLYLVILVVFSWHDHRFAFSWFYVELTTAISLPGILIQLWKSWRPA